MSVAVEALHTHGVQWPALPLADWHDTYDTLHLYTQIVGKIPLALCAPLNHWWQVAYTVTSRGLMTSPIPFGERTFEIEFDFVDHNLVVRTSDGQTRELALIPRTVAEFYRNVLGILASLGLAAQIRPIPAEISDPVPFEKDSRHFAYDARAVQRFFHIVREVDTVLKAFRGRFLGKSSPVQFFWEASIWRSHASPAAQPIPPAPTRSRAKRTIAK